MTDAPTESFVTAEQQLTPDERIQIIEDSMSAFGCSLLSPLPIVGIIFALRALKKRRYVRGLMRQSWKFKLQGNPADLDGRELNRLAKKGWNPALGYLRWASVLARLGIVVWLLTTLGIVVLLEYFYH